MELHVLPWQSEFGWLRGFGDAAPWPDPPGHDAGQVDIPARLGEDLGHLARLVSRFGHLLQRNGDAAAPLVAEIYNPGSDALAWEWSPVEDHRADQRKEVYALKDEGLSLRDIEKRTGVARSTVADWLKKRA